MIANTSNLTEKLSIFSGLPESVKKEFTLAARVRKCKKGESIFLHADRAASFFLISSGAIRLHRQTPQGKDVTLYVAGVGDMLGDHELFEGKTNYQSCATSAEESVVLEYSARWIKEKMSAYPELILNMLASISRASSMTSIDKEHLFTLSAPQRVGCFLMRLCAVHQLNPQNFALPYAKVTIASKLGMEPESFSRALVRLKDVGVKVDGNDVSISSIMALDKYVCTACSISEDCKTCETHRMSCGQEKLA